MARWEFKLPDIGEGVTEGEIVSWLVKPGDVVKEDQPMVEVMTDKATVTIAAPRAGTIVETRGKVGDIVKVHAVLVVFELGGRRGAGDRARRTVTRATNGTNGTRGNGGKDDGPAATAVGDIKREPAGDGRRESARGGVPRRGAAGATASRVLQATSRSRRRRRASSRASMNVDLTRVPPTGPAGARDEGATCSTFATAPAPAPRGSRRERRAGAAAAATPARRRARAGQDPRAGGRPQAALEERVPFAGHAPQDRPEDGSSRRRPPRTSRSSRSATSRAQGAPRAPEAAAEAHGVKLTFLPFIVKACVAALKKHPILNSALDESTNELVYRKYYNIGIATSTDAGLMVPVVKDADRKSLLDVARDIERVATDAKAGKSKLEDLTGSTFTITSLGAQGGLFATPIINFPEVGILGVHRIKQKPVVRDGQIVVGEVMLLSLSFDHRIVDGHVGAAFAYDVIGYLEEPDRLLFEMA